MPFGLIFGALFFGLLCSWLGARFLGLPGGPAKLAGVLLIALGLSMALGLLKRRVWARWAGVVVALGLALFGLWAVQNRGDAPDLLLLFASVVATVLLVLPATAGERRADGVPSQPGRLLPAVAGVSASGLAVLAVLALQAPEPEPQAPVLPTALAERVVWADFGAGLERARQEGKPMLVNFITTWCGYCKQMDRTTWKHPSVIERLNEMVPVKVDTEDTRERNGQVGLELANRYRISGTPAMLLLGADGRVLARTGGYQDPRQFLTWLEDALNAAGRTDPMQRLRVSGS
jgi:thiol:disulfide interchange protein